MHCTGIQYYIYLNAVIYRQQSISFFTRVSTKPTNPAMYMEKDHLRLLRNFLNSCRISGADPGFCVRGDDIR